MIAYCIKSILCLALLWGFYKLFLEKEQIHFLKRFYLLFSLILALTIPLLTFTYEKEVVLEPEIVLQNTIPLTDTPGKPQIQQPSAGVVEVNTAEDFYVILWGVYILGVVIFGFRFIKNIRAMFLKIKRHDKLFEPSHINVLLQKNVIPYTFLNYIFVPKTTFQENGIPAEVLQHEKTHVLQKHTLDILFVEALQVAFWFNPLFIPLKKAIRLNHEFLADQNVLKQQFSIQNYVELLVNYPNSLNQTVLASPINYSLTKKRLQMMTTHFSRKRVALKICALIPVVMGCILLFNNEIVAKEVVYAEASVTALDDTESTTIKASDNIVTIHKEEPVQDGISKAELKEYKQWIKRVKQESKSGNGIRLQKEEVDRMEMLYNAMSSDQKSKVEKLTDVVPPPPPSPRVGVGEVSNIPPPPPPVDPNHDNIPEAPEPPEVPEIDPVEIEIEEESLAEVEREIEEAMLEAAEVQMEAMASMEEDELQRAIAMEQAQISREQAEIIRKQAMEQARAARAVALEAAQLARKEARAHAEQARARAMKEATKAREHALKEAQNARKYAEKARVEAIKEARKAQLKRNTYSSYPLMKEMANKDAEFYYNGKKISSEKALEIIRTYGDNLSINAKTKNGKSKVKIRN